MQQWSEEVDWTRGTECVWEPADNLPPSLGHLTKLVVLRVHSNALHSLPNLHNAVSLHVSGDCMFWRKKFLSCIYFIFPSMCWHCVLAFVVGSISSLCNSHISMFRGQKLTCLYITAVQRSAEMIKNGLFRLFFIQPLSINSSINFVSHDLVFDRNHNYIIIHRWHKW